MKVDLTKFDPVPGYLASILAASERYQGRGRVLRINETTAIVLNPGRTIPTWAAKAMRTETLPTPSRKTKASVRPKKVQPIGGQSGQ